MTKIFIVAFLIPFVPGKPFAQSIPNSKDSLITIPFQNLPLENIIAEGDKDNGVVKLSLDFKNIDKKLAVASLSMGGAENFSFKTDNGKKYAIHTYHNPLLQDDPNKGSLRIDHVQFGNNKMDVATTLQQEINANSHATLLIKFKANKSCKEIQNFYVSCIYSPDWVYEGVALYEIKKIPINWK